MSSKRTVSFTHLRPFAVILALAVALASCGGSDGGGTTTPTIESITLDPQTATLTFAGQVVTFLAVVRDSEGATVSAPLTWSSSASSVATVDQSGTVTAVGNGTATITAATSGVSASATVTVDPVAATVTISPASATIDVGATATFSATVEDGAGNPIPDAVPTWSSSNEGVASVNSGGVVTGVTGGSATITVSVDDVSAAAAITVNPEVASIEITPAADTIDIGATTTLAATARDPAGDAIANVDITWSSGDQSIATVDDSGVVTGVAGGTVEISATADGVTGTAEVRVTPPDLVITEDTTLGGTVTVDEFTVADGVTLTLDGDLTVEAEGRVEIRGAVIGTCRGFDVYTSDSLIVRGNVDLACTGGESSPPAFKAGAGAGVVFDGVDLVLSGDVLFGDAAAPAGAALRLGSGARILGPTYRLFNTSVRHRPAKAPPGADGASVEFGFNSKANSDYVFEIEDATFELQSGGDGGGETLIGPGVYARGLDGGAGGSATRRVTGDAGEILTRLTRVTFRLGSGGNGGNASATGTADGASGPPSLVRAAPGNGGPAGRFWFFSEPTYQEDVTVAAGSNGDAGSFLVSGADGPDATENTAARPGGSAYVFLPKAAEGFTLMIGDQEYGSAAAGAVPGGSLAPGRGGHGNAVFSAGAEGGLAVADWEPTSWSYATGLFTIPYTIGQPVGVSGGEGGMGGDLCGAPQTISLNVLLTVLSDPANSNQFIFNTPDGGLAYTLDLIRRLAGVGGNGGPGGSLTFGEPHLAGVVVANVADAFNGGAGGRAGGVGGAAGSIPAPVGPAGEWTISTMGSLVEGAAGGSCPSAGPSLPTVSLSAEGGVTTIRFTGAAPFIDVSGTLSEDGSFSASGTGDMVGSTVDVTFTGTYDVETGELSGDYAMDTEKVISSGHPLIYRITAGG